MIKKIGLFTTIIIVSLLVVTTIILGAIKKDYSPNFQASFKDVTVTNTGFYYSRGLLGDEEDFNKLVKLYNDSFKQSLLASLFGGNLRNEITVTYSRTSISSENISGYKIVWNLNSNGEKVKLTNDLETEYLIDKLTVGIEDSSTFKNVTIYAKIKDSSANEHLKITTKANFEALYDYLEELSA